jgi:hypothetical protein
MGLFLLFIDGMGLGDEDAGINPFVRAFIPNFKALMRDNMVPTDATLGVEGLPQSATGQTTLFTGINASQLLGRHLHGFPNKELRHLIMEHSLLKRLKDKGYRVANCNAYRDEYVSQILKEDTLGKRKVLKSVTTVATLAAGIRLRTMEHLLEGRAIYHDITNEILLKKGYKVPLSDENRAVHTIISLMKDHDFLFFEYFLTDIAGHGQQMDVSVDIIQLLDRFIGKLIKNVDLKKNLIIITSDHGNIEDITTKTHTLNKVPTFLIGSGQDKLKGDIKLLTDISPAIEKGLTLLEMPKALNV